MRSKIVRRFVIICALTVLVISIIIVVLVKTFNSNEVFLTIVPKSYCYVSENSNSENIELYVYVSNKKSFLTKKDNVMHSYIQSKDRADELLIELVSINDLYTKAEINNKSYYLYSFEFKVPIDAIEEYELAIPRAIISVDYPEDTVKFNIGSFYFYKIPYYGDKEANLSVSKVKGIVNNVGMNKSLVGVEFGFRNNTNRDIVIKNVQILDKTVYASMNEVVLVNKEIKSSDDISMLLNYDYDLYEGNDDGNCNLSIKKGEVVNYLIPLKYRDNFIINSIAFKITYEIDNNLYVYYSDNINLFNDMNVYIDQNKLEIMSYDFNY